MTNPVTTANQNEEVGQKQRPRILVVEDERIEAMALQVTLEHLGYEVAGLVASGEDAITRAGQLRPDLVLMDIHLEGEMDGVEAGGILHHRFHVPVVYLTAYPDQEVVGRVKLTEPFGYVLKSCESLQLSVAIELALYKHQMERQLLEQKRLLDATLRSIGDAVVTADSAGAVRGWNAAAERLYGWTAEEAVGQHISVLVPEERRHELGLALARIRRGEQVPAHETVHQCKDGSRVEVIVTIACLKDEVGQVVGAAMVVRDVTHLRHLEEESRRAEKLAAIGQVAGGVAHELRNPLNVIRTSVYFLLNARNPSPEKVGEHLRRVEHQVDDADRVITTLSNFARMPLPEMRHFSAECCVREALAGNPLPENILVEVDFSAGLSPALGDSEQLRIVFANLIRNARDAMPRGGKLSITGRQTADGVEVAVRDTGVGIAREALSRVMEPLCSTKARGIGLGLALSRAILDKNRGSVSATSELGRGSTFTVRLLRE